MAEPNERDKAAWIDARLAEIRTAVNEVWLPDPDADYAAEVADRYRREAEA